MSLRKIRKYLSNCTNEYFKELKKLFEGVLSQYIYLANKHNIKVAKI